MSSSFSVPPLPAELVQHILSSAFPPHSTNEYHPQRNVDVLRCCLVSKAWHSMAEPLLWPLVSLPNASHCLERIADQPLAKRQLTMCLELGSEVIYPRSRVDTLRAALELFPNVEQVRVDGQPDSQMRRPISLQDFEVLHKLKTLNLNTGVSVELEAALPHLEALRLCGGSIRQSFYRVLTPSAFPSLRHLVLTSFGESGVRLARAGHLVQQLDMLELDSTFAFHDWHTPYTDFRNVLLTFSTDDLTSSIGFPPFSSRTASFPHPPRYIRIVASRKDRSLDWSLLESSIFGLAYRPTALFLPRALAMAASEPGATQDAREVFLDRCTTERVEILFCRSADHDVREVGWAISGSMSRSARGGSRRRARRTGKVRD